MAGIASDILNPDPSNHLDPSCNSWDKIYCAENSWQSDIRKACCLDWMLHNLEKVHDLLAEFRTCDDPLTAISYLSPYRTSCMDCVGTYFEKAKALLEKPRMRRFIDQLAEPLSSQHKLSKDMCIKIWNASGLWSCLPFCARIFALEHS